MSLDTKLKRINACVDCQRQFNKPTPKLVLAKATASATPGLQLPTCNLTTFTTPVMSTIPTKFTTTPAPEACCLYTPVLTTISQPPALTVNRLAICQGIVLNQDVQT